MEHIPGYDNWKTTPPEPRMPLAECIRCGAEFFEGDFVYTIDGENWCEDCLKDEFGRFL